MLQGAIKKLAHEIFHDHKQLNEQQMKELLKKKLDGDEHCVDFLNKINAKGISYDNLWEKKLCSIVSIYIPVYITLN